jgi:hypothetical protein
MPTIQARDNTEVSCRDWATEQLFAFVYSRLLSGDVLRRCISLTRVLCLIVPLVATIAKAQELPDATANATRPASGWWSPAKAESAPEPHLAISMAELTHFEASGSFQTFPAQRTTYRVTEPMDAQIASLQYIGVGVAKPSLLADRGSLPTGSFLSLLQAKYAAWESSLADSRSLVDVNGVSVYPLLQINYAGWHLPVALYLSSLRGSDAR